MDTMVYMQSYMMMVFSESLLGEVGLGTGSGMYDGGRCGMHCGLGDGGGWRLGRRKLIAAVGWSFLVDAQCVCP